MLRNKPRHVFSSSHRPRCRSWMWRMNGELTVWPPGYSLTFCFPANFCWIHSRSSMMSICSGFTFPLPRAPVGCGMRCFHAVTASDDALSSPDRHRLDSKYEEEKAKDRSLKLKPVKYLYVCKSSSLVWFGSNIRLLKKNCSMNNWKSWCLCKNRSVSLIKLSFNP